ncbi:hypothetical protein FRC00_003707, partial [Tulasnella sp. 408]
MTSSPREGSPFGPSSYLENLAGALAKVPGYDFDSKKTEKGDGERSGKKIIRTVTNSPVHRVPPRVGGKR